MTVSVTLRQRTRASARPKRRSGRTRELLIRATLDLLAQQGTQGVTASRIAEAAGIAQPNFYAYFENVDDCLREAAERVARETRIAISSLRAVQQAAPEDVALLTKHYEDILELSVLGQPATQIFLKLRGDASVVGEVMRELVEQVRADLVVDLFKLAEERGHGSAAWPRVELLAEITLSAVLGVWSALIEGRAKSLRLAARVLALSAISTTKAVFGDLSKERKRRSGSGARTEKRDPRSE